jgi:FAD:protein FMN transferase
VTGPAPPGVAATTNAECQRHTFDAMGTDIEFLVETELCGESTAALRAVETEFHRLDSLLSRFRADSELSVLNRYGALLVGPELLDIVEFALAARSQTGGRFDPTVHDAVVAAGYDRTFESLPADTDDSAPPVGAPCGGGVTVDRGQCLIEIEPGFRLDLGGIAKGYAVDRACDLLCTVGPCCVNAGGDLAVRGSLHGGPWPVGVDTPTGTITLALSHGAMATSGRDRRRWRRGGEERHHIIDPSTGRSAETGLLNVTVVAGTAVAAEIQAKSLFLAGEWEAIREADELGMPCLLVTSDGRTVRAGGLT